MANSEITFCNCVSNSIDIDIISTSCVFVGAVMRTVSGAQRAPAIESERSIVGDDEQLFGSVLSEVARTLWPQKTAANIAASANCSVRAAEFYLAGDRDWSGDAIAAIVSEILRRHSMRNVKVVPKR